MLNVAQLEILLELALKTSKSAFLAAKENLTHIRKVENDLTRDVKVIADKRLEAFIIKELKQKTPYSILTEESGTILNKSHYSSYRWIIDPLDGSLNFSRYIPICCISIAFWKDMDPLFGVIYDFNRDEMFAGLVGEGAWLNGSPITAGKAREKKDAVLCTGFPVSTDFSQPALLEFVDNIRQYKKVRLLGSAALSLAYVAAGRVDAYLEKDIAVWDVAAGLALVLAAGGVVHFSQGRSEYRLIVKAGNKRLLSGKTDSLPS